jgi:hypothetical protein
MLNRIHPASRTKHWVPADEGRRNGRFCGNTITTRFGPFVGLHVAVETPERAKGSAQCETKYPRIVDPAGRDPERLARKAFDERLVTVMDRRDAA